MRTVGDEIPNDRRLDRGCLAEVERVRHRRRLRMARRTAPTPSGVGAAASIEPCMGFRDTLKLGKVWYWRMGLFVNGPVHGVVSLDFCHPCPLRTGRTSNNTPTGRGRDGNPDGIVVTGARAGEKAVTIPSTRRRQHVYHQLPSRQAAVCAAGPIREGLQISLRSAPRSEDRSPRRGRWASSPRDSCLWIPCRNGRPRCRSERRCRA